MNNPFEVLGLKGWAGPDEIRNAYRALVKQCHPDMIQDPSEKEAAQNRMVALNLSCAEAVLLAQRAMARDNPEGALRALSRCEEKSGEWYYMQGKVLMALEEYESAHQAFREAVRTSPENNVYREGALDAAVASQKAATIQGKAKKVLKNLFRK